MQEIKRFIYGHNIFGSEYNALPLDKQINTFIKENPNYILKNMSVVLGNGFNEAYVVFDVKEERTDKAQKYPNKTNHVTEKE